MTLALGFALFLVGRVDLPQEVAGYSAQSRTYFVDSPTLRAVEKESVALWELPFVRGEKTTFVCGEENRDGLVKALLDEFSCKEVWTEEVNGILSYYATSEFLPRKVVVQGSVVNLHIAVREGEVVVGTPIIFGGY